MLPIQRDMLRYKGGLDHAQIGEEEPEEPGDGQEQPGVAIGIDGQQHASREPPVAHQQHAGDAQAKEADGRCPDVFPGRGPG